MTSFAHARRRFRRAVLGRRRLLAALCTAVAVAAGLHSVEGPPPPTTTVVTAARSLPSGTVLAQGDLQEVEFTPGSVPQGTLPVGELVGRTTAGPLRQGEPLTDVGLVRGSLLDGYPGMVAVPVRIADADSVGLLRVGDRIDLLAAGELTAHTVGADVVVLALPRGRDEDATTSGGGRLVVVAMPEESAAETAQAGVSSPISVVIRR